MKHHHTALREIIITNSFVAKCGRFSTSKEDIDTSKALFFGGIPQSEWKKASEIRMYRCIDLLEYIEKE